jgi:YggT family protein
MGLPSIQSGSIPRGMILESDGKKLIRPMNESWQIRYHKHNNSIKKWTKSMDWLTIISWGLGLTLAGMTLMFIFRIVMTWYPQVNEGRLPFSLVTYPTEPFLAVTRKLIPPIGGVDMTPILWVGVCSLLRELLLGQQGLITLLSRLY